MAEILTTAALQRRDAVRREARARFDEREAPDTDEARLLTLASTNAMSRERPGAWPSSGSTRIAWVDYAKGWCIVLVVAMHSALGVGLAVDQQSWLYTVAAFAKPFRMPDFFLVAGLFAAGAIHGSWHRLLDRKILHFGYFYALWLFVELALKARDLAITTPTAFAREYGWHLVEPFGSMWFLQALPLLYLATRFSRDLPLAVSLTLAVALHYLAASAPSPSIYSMESQLTALTTLNSLLLFWVYFLTGYRARAGVFRAAAWLEGHPRLAFLMLAAWAIFEALVTESGLSNQYGFDLPLGLLGAGAVMTASVLLARLRLVSWLAALGRQSLTIYLAFFLPMAAARLVLIRLAPNADTGILSLAVTAAAIAGPLLLRRLAAGTPLAFLFTRPEWTRLRDRSAPSTENSSLLAP